MDPKLLLVKAGTLLYKESQLGDPSIQSAGLVKEIVASVKVPETGMDIDRSREVMQSLRLTVAMLCDQPAGQPIDRSSLLQRVRLNSGDDEGLYYAFEQGLDEERSQDRLKQQCIVLRCELRDHINQSNIKEIMKQFSHQVNFRPDTVNWRHLLQEVNEKLAPYTSVNFEEDEVVGVLDVVDLSDAENVVRLMRKAAEETSLDGILKTGYQAINRMLGDHGGFRRGEFAVIGALQHNYKTGFTLNLFKHFALYNKPYMRDPTKKPLLIHVSAENELSLNVQQLYASLWENEHHTECDLSIFTHPDPAVVEDALIKAQLYIGEKLSVNGYTVMMARVDPSETTYVSIQEMIMKYESQGYEIHAIVYDYLNMISKRGCLSNGPTGSDIRDLFRRVRNIVAPRGICFITPHQISTEAMQLIRQGVPNFVKEIANKLYYDGCKTIAQEVDVEMFIHIENVNGDKFLTCHRGKHRKVRPTPEKHLYTVLPFHAAGAIRDDLLGQDLSVRVPGGGKRGTEEEIPWFTPSGALPT